MFPPCCYFNILGVLAPLNPVPETDLLCPCCSRVSLGSPSGCSGSGSGSGATQLLSCPQALLCLHPLSPEAVA